jgi:hypothetical protein
MNDIRGNYYWTHKPDNTLDLLKGLQGIGEGICKKPIENQCRKIVRTCLQNIMSMTKIRNLKQ